MRRPAIAHHLASFLGLVALGGTIAGCQEGDDREPGSPRQPMLVIAVGQPGSVLNAVGTGVAKLATEQAGIPMRVRVTSGMDAIVGAGDAELGVSASDSTHLSSRGLRHYEGRAQHELRLALAGPPLMLGFIVQKDSDIQGIADLENRKVPGDYPNARPMHHDGNVMLGTVGLSWDSVDVVPVASFRDGVQAFIEGRTAATISSVASGMTQQADASLGGVRFLTLPSDQDLSDRMWSAEPGFHAVSVNAGFALGIEEDMVLAAKEIYLTANANASPEAVQSIVSLLWDQVETLSSVHPVFSRWSREHMINSRVTIPFHEGTVQFLREQDAWTPAHDEVQRRLLRELTE